jgi:hypothetical protein
VIPLVLELLGTGAGRSEHVRRFRWRCLIVGVGALELRA